MLLLLYNKMKITLRLGIHYQIRFNDDDIAAYVVVALLLSLIVCMKFLVLVILSLQTMEQAS